ncbi:putative methylenetetrahydrofolate reductase [Trichinella sp. T6]|nr:putative methylenetetrahydrofolate reductase [Trichinella sp. T6]
MFPWKKHTVHSVRCREAVRPIYWTARPKSYLCRTRDWKQFPHSRWGDVGNPAFGNLKHYLFSCIDQMDDSCALDMWDKELSTLEHVRDIFCNFIARTPNRHGHSVRRLPWNENHLDPAADYYQLPGCCKRLAFKYVYGSINGQNSSMLFILGDPIFGWGEANGYIYQKGYLEFFASSTCTTILLNHVQNFPSINYHAINFDGSFETFNYDEDATVALTWGVFVGQEIVQPTVANAASFRVWKVVAQLSFIQFSLHTFGIFLFVFEQDEAFDLWQRWAGLYESRSIGRKLLQRIHDDYRLITLIDNDYPQPCSLSALLRAVISDYWGKKLDDG